MNIFAKTDAQDAEQLVKVRYIVAYLESDDIRAEVMTGAAWFAFIAGLICLMFNRFYHFIFSYSDDHEYIPESGRHTIFIFLLVFYLGIAIRMFIVSWKSSGRQSVRYRAVAYTSVAFGVFMFLQILTSFCPLYVIGLLIGTCVVHSYVEAGDEYLKENAKLLCDIFKHSPVFRVGGDEFVVFLRGDDYDRKQELMDKLRNQVLENKESGV